jgi:hypothetical protein
MRIVGTKGNRAISQQSRTAPVMRIVVMLRGLPLFETGVNYVVSAYDLVNCGFIYYCHGR